MLTNLILLIAGILAFSIEGHPQQAFPFQYSTLQDEWPTDAIETPDGGFIISAGIGTYSPWYYSALLIKLDSSGDTIMTKTISKSTGSCIIGDLVKAADGNFFGIGRQVFSDEDRIWLVKINSDLEIIKDTTYSIDAFNIFIYYGLTDQYDNLVVFGSAAGNDLYNHPYIYKLTQEGDSVSYRYYNDSTSSEYVNSMIEKPDLSGYYMVILGDYQISMPTSEQILTIDYNLNVVDIDSLPGHYALYYNIKVFNGHQFIYTGKKITSNSPRTDKIGIQKLDTNFFTLASNFLGPEDTITYPANRNIDFIDTNRIFLAGTSNQNISTPFPMNVSFYLIGVVDASLNTGWVKYYGGDQYYHAEGVLATTDGGCLIHGSSFNYQTQTDERDIFIIKVDSSGVVTSSGPDPLPLLHDAIVYPNPGSDYFIVESGPQIKGANLVLYNLHGYPVKTATIDDSFQIINTADLPSGCYVWQISFNGVLVESGKWIRN
jgi:hypothetical protein